MLLRLLLVMLSVTAGVPICGQSIQPPYSSSYTLVWLGPISQFVPSYGSLAFQNTATLLVTDPVENADATIYKVPVSRGSDGHINGLGTPVAYAAATSLDAGLAYGPGDVLFANSAYQTLYEFKPGSTSPDLTVDLTNYGYPVNNYGALQFVPPGFPGAGGLKIIDFQTGGFWDVALSQNASGTYDVSSVRGPLGTPPVNTIGASYVPPGSAQFSSPSVLLEQYVGNPIWAYTLDSDGNPTGTGTVFISAGFAAYGTAVDPLTGDMFFVNTGNYGTNKNVGVYEVQGFHPATLSSTGGATQSAIVAGAFAMPLTVTLQDAFGNPISNVQVSFAAPTSGATATLSATTATTAADGTASVTATANTLPGTYMATATLYNISTTFSLTNVALSALTLSPSPVVGGHPTSANTVTLTSAAPAGGATITLSSSNPSVAAVPQSVTVAGGSTVSAPFTIMTTAVASTTHVEVKASDGTNTKTAILTVKPASLTAVNLSPKSVVGGHSTTNNTVTLRGPAPAAGAVVSLSSSEPTVATVPVSVTVPAGATVSPTFTITTTAVAAQTPVTISATYNGVTKTATLTVNSAQLAQLKLSQSTIKGGQVSTGNLVALNGAAPGGGAAVMLTSSNPGVASVPATVTVVASATYRSFRIKTTAVTANT
ncbi:MAG: Ig-like domain-containing protein, partial [Bryobacteraceae bacterium]